MSRNQHPSRVRGERHPNAKLSDHDVDLIRELHAEHRIGYQTLATKFEVSKENVRDVVKYRRR